VAAGARPGGSDPLDDPVRILLEDGDGRRRTVPFGGVELTIGRAADSGLLLTGRDVSRHHARLHRSNGSVFVEDLGSANGTRVNGERVQGRRRIREGDLVQIGGFDLAVEGVPGEGPDAATLPAPPPLPGAAAPRPPSPDRSPRFRSAEPARPGARRLLVLAAVALAALALGYGAGRVLRGPAGPAEQAAR
jgi:hypothetical protein